MTVVVDTVIFIDHLRGHRAATRLIIDVLAQQSTRLVASVLTKTELLAGMRDHQEREAHALIAVIDWIPVDEVIADRAGELAHRYLRSQPGVDLVDYVIAATVQSMNAELWTRNIKHFPMFPELQTPY
jgi:predicted nucleic acid-binding protein